MKGYDNNMFKYATKELSQDAFLCWCINWINSDEHYILGREFLEMIVKGIIPNLNYEKDMIEVEIRKQYYNMDILLIINKKYFIIIEDKVDSIEHIVGKSELYQLDNYKEKLREMLDESQAQNEKERQKILNKKEQLNIDEFNSEFVYGVLIKTGEIQNKDINVHGADKIITSTDILKVIKDYIRINSKCDIVYILNDFKEYIENKNDLLDENKSDKFVGKEMKIKTKFGKKYHCINCFSDQIKFKNGKTKYTRNYQYKRHGYKPLTKKVCIWTPRLYSNGGEWVNKVYENNDEIHEFHRDNSQVNLETEKYVYRYVFVRKRDVYNKEFFEFLGVFYLDYKKSSNYIKIWRRYKKDVVSLNAQKIEKEIEENKI